ncbi:uncharacterized protein LOC143205256 [Rhynchophorus ferrugineus]|uniref:uncharacterized protein LOC143205256 n=1 Tax=Rhynchophorus ferrugineus TaxID=354439 RepID=UPI003FCCF18F
MMTRLDLLAISCSWISCDQKYSLVVRYLANTSTILAVELFLYIKGRILAHTSAIFPLDYSCISGVLVVSTAFSHCLTRSGPSRTPSLPERSEHLSNPRCIIVQCRQ